VHAGSSSSGVHAGSSSNGVRAGGAVIGLVAEPGVLLIGFALVFGAAVAFGHTVVVRYTTPIVPFLWTGAALLVGGRAPRGR
jgi:hypothetical protein